MLRLFDYVAGYVISCKLFLLISLSSFMQKFNLSLILSLHRQIIFWLERKFHGINPTYIHIFVPEPLNKYINKSNVLIC